MHFHSYKTKNSRINDLNKPVEDPIMNKMNLLNDLELEKVSGGRDMTTNEHIDLNNTRIAVVNEIKELSKAGKNQEAAILSVKYNEALQEWRRKIENNYFRSEFLFSEFWNEYKKTIY